MISEVIDADQVNLGANVTVGEGSRIVARTVSLGDNVTIGNDVVICGDDVEIGADVRIAARARLISSEIHIGQGCSFGSSLQAELNDWFRIGPTSDLGRDLRVVGRGFSAGAHVWLTDAILIGGGGARGPRSFCAIGDRSAVMERCFINVSEPVAIGNDTALSNGVTVLTHSLWHPALLGGTVVFAPTTIGDRNILYVNAVIAPGVRTGNDVTIAAGALVLQDVPDGCTALGNPARIVKTVPTVPRDLDEPRKDQVIREVLRSYRETLPVKGVEVATDSETDAVHLTFDGRLMIVRYLSTSTASGESADITLAFGDGGRSRGLCHFDLAAATMTGQSSPIAEDLRDHLRRRTIRIFTDRPFQPLPPANIARLRARLRRS